VYGLAAPIFDGDGKVVGSLSCVRPAAERHKALEQEQGEQMVALAHTLSRHMLALTHSANPSSKPLD
jgi:DNA-binding IclR family transcriptional regulator